MNIIRVFCIVAFNFLFFLQLGISQESWKQERGEMWVKTFKKGSSDLNDSTIDKKTLLFLDSLVTRKNIEIIFYGSADELDWKLWGRGVSRELNSAWNDAKRLGRALALRERYKRGVVSITHENIRGVKVVWSPTLYSEIKKYVNSFLSTTDSIHTVINNTTIFSNIGIKIGWWSLVGDVSVPNLALEIKTIIPVSLIIRGGVSPYKKSNNKRTTRNSFFYIGSRHWKSSRLGFNFGLQYTWEFLTATDNWVSRSIGFSLGTIYRINRFEINTEIANMNIDRIGENKKKNVKLIIGIDFNLK